MWRELVEAVHPEAAFSPPASQEQLDEAEARLRGELPSDLRALLAETDGIEGEHGLGVVWPVERIVRDDSEFPTSYAETYMSFDALLFFADAGNGDQFAFPITADGRTRSEVFAWDHVDDSRTWVASNLREYLRGWLSGQLKL